MPRAARTTHADPVADLERLKKSIGAQHDRLAELLPKLEGGLKQAVQDTLTAGEAIRQALEGLDVAGTAQDQKDLLAIASRHAGKATPKPAERLQVPEPPPPVQAPRPAAPKAPQAPAPARPPAAGSPGAVGPSVKP